MDGHISVTQAGMYLRCPMQHYYRYVEGLKVPPRGAMVLGSAVHEAAASSYARIADGARPDPEEAATVAAEALERRIEEDEPLLDAEAGETPGALKDAAASGAAAHASELAPAVAKPSLIEQRIEAVVADVEDGGEPVKVVAIVDVYDEAAHAVRDLKVVGRAKSAQDAAESVQLNLYALMLGAAGKPVEKVAYDSVVVTAAKPKARTAPAEAEASQQRAAAALASVMGAARGIRQGIYYHRTEGWHCSPKWCGYWDRCTKDREKVWQVVTAAPLGKADATEEEE